jgi:hypothetical protein
MEQREIVVYLHLKVMTAIDIHNDLVDTLVDGAVSYPTVTL